MKANVSNKLQVYIIPAILFVICFCWKLFFITQRDICIDEPFTIFNAQKSLGDIVQLNANGEPNPPLFMILLHYWLRLFGDEAQAVRLLPLLFNSITVLFIYFTGKRFFNFQAGLVAACLFIFSNIHFFHGLEVRTYSLFSMATAASLYFFMVYLKNNKSIKSLIWLIIFNLIMVYSHYFGWFVIFSQFICGFLYIRNFKLLLRLQIPTIATVIGYLPMVPIIIRQFMDKSSRGTWVKPPTPIEYLNHLLLFFNNKEVMLVLILVVTLGVIFTLYLLFKKKWKGFSKSLVVLLIWWFVPYTIMYMVSYEVPMFIGRYVLFNTIGLYLFIAALVSFLFQNNKYLEAIAGIAIVAFMMLNFSTRSKVFGHREIKNTVDFIKTHEGNPGNRIIILYPNWSDFLFMYHYDRSLFHDPDNFSEACLRKKIFHVWSLTQAKEIINRNKGKRIILFKDSNSTQPEERFLEYLDSTYNSVEKAFFPDTFHVGIYDTEQEKRTKVVNNQFHSIPNNGNLT